MKNLTTVARITKDVVLETRNIGGNEVAVANFNVVENTPTRKKDDEGHRIYKTTFIRVSLWRDQAKSLVPFLKKGRMVALTGDFDAGTYLDQTTNQVRPVIHMTSPSLQLLDGNGGAAAVEPGEPELPELPFGDE